MIVKSLIILSLIANSLGLTPLSERFDQAIIRHEYAPDYFANAKSISYYSLPDILPRPQIAPGAEVPAILAVNYLLADAVSGKIILKQAFKDEVPIASTTKIMSAVVVLENYDLKDVVTVSAAAAGQIGASANLVPGEKMTVQNLLKAMLIKSANGAAYALAEHMNEPGEKGTDKFVAAMNKKAKELGMENTNYHDPAGLDTTGYSSAYDLFIVTRYALKDTVFSEIVGTYRESVTNTDGTLRHSLENSNRLVGEYQYSGAKGVKTGYMPEAGHVLVSAAERDGHTLIGVVINTFADTPQASADESRKLLDWGFKNIVW